MNAKGGTNAEKGTVPFGKRLYRESTAGPGVFQVYTPMFWFTLSLVARLVHPMSRHRCAHTYGPASH